MLLRILLPSEPTFATSPAFHAPVFGSVQMPTFRVQARPHLPPTSVRNQQNPAIAPLHATERARSTLAENQAPSLIGPNSRIMRLTNPRAVRPVNTLVSTVPVTAAPFKAARWGRVIFASAQHK